MAAQSIGRTPGSVKAGGLPRARHDARHGTVVEANCREKGTSERMGAILLDGRSLAARLRAELAEKAQSIAAERGRRASLALVIAGENASALLYGAQVQRSCARAGVDCALLRLPGEIGEAESA